MENQEAFLDAIKAGDVNRVQALLEQNPELVNARMEDDLSPVMVATYYGQREVAQLLARRSPNLTIFEASATGDLERVRALLRLDPSLANAFASDGFQPLGLASFFDYPEVVRLLVESGADVNNPSNNVQRVTPLHSAAAAQDVETARLLLERGADPNARQAGGFTPLHTAGENGQIEMIRLLLEHGADPAVQAEDGKSPLDLAQERGFEEAIKLLSP